MKRISALLIGLSLSGPAMALTPADYLANVEKTLAQTGHAYLCDNKLGDMSLEQAERALSPVEEIGHGKAEDGKHNCRVLKRPGAR